MQLEDEERSLIPFLRPRLKKLFCLDLCFETACSDICFALFDCDEDLNFLRDLVSRTIRRHRLDQCNDIFFGCHWQIT
jgi:hypothetical protein